MIRCHLRHLEARCRERGYTLDEVRPCIASEDGTTITVDETHPAYPRTPKPGVSLLKKAANFAASAAKHVAAGIPQCSDEERERRFAICQACEHFDGRACKLCGCPIVRQKKFISKLSWASSSCPAGKWGKEAAPADTSK